MLVGGGGRKYSNDEDSRTSRDYMECGATCTGTTASQWGGGGGGGIAIVVPILYLYLVYDIGICYILYILSKFAEHRVGYI